MVRKIKLQAKNREFCRKISELSGEVVMLCEQCGTCTGSCPMLAEMDITPSQMVRLVQLGQEVVLEHKTFWVCASCYTCTVRCPRGIDPAKIAEALRQVKLRQAIDYIQIDEIAPEEAKKLPAVALVAAFRKLTG